MALKLLHFFHRLLCFIDQDTQFDATTRFQCWLIIYNSIRISAVASRESENDFMHLILTSLLVGLGGGLSWIRQELATLFFLYKNV